MAELKIRNISKGTVAELDTKARVAGLSREEYLRRLLERHVQGNSLTEQANVFEELVSQVLTVVEDNTIALTKFNKINGVNEDDE